MAKRKAPREAETATEPKKTKKDVVLPPVVKSDDPVPKQKKWTNKTRVLVFCSRGVSFRTRHLMKDLQTLLPHSKSESKMDRKDKLHVINEICEMKNCNKCLFFEAKKKQDLYLWAANTPQGPSAKFLVENVHTMSELKMTGNCLRGSRPLLSFDKNFTEQTHLVLLKELFIQCLGVPQYHPKSQPFIDKVFSFSWEDNRIWFRNYQIVEEDGTLLEIGPRFVLNPIAIFDGSFGGQVLYKNPQYISPNLQRRLMRRNYKYIQRVEAKRSRESRRPEPLDPTDPTEDVFVTIRPEEAKEHQVEKKDVSKKRRRKKPKKNGLHGME